MESITLKYDDTQRRSVWKGGEGERRKKKWNRLF
jgi:hypothetical protein